MCHVMLSSRSCHTVKSILHENGWLVILSNGLDVPGVSRMNHFTAEIVSLVKQISLVESSLDGHTLMIFFF